MSHSLRQTEGGSAAQTLPPTADDSLPLALREHGTNIDSAAPAAGGAHMNQQEESAALNACKQPRRLTIGCTGIGAPRPDVPFLRLSGRWLERAGFAIGRRVKVEVSEGRLMIEPLD